MEFSAVLIDMSVHRNKKCGSICKANTVSDATEKIFISLRNNLQIP